MREREATGVRDLQVSPGIESLRPCHRAVRANSSSMTRTKASSG
jgi:hypothetical protein